MYFISTFRKSLRARSHGVMVSTLDFESSDPSSNLGGTSKAAGSNFILVFDFHFAVRQRDMKNIAREGPPLVRENTVHEENKSEQVLCCPGPIAYVYTTKG